MLISARKRAAEEQSDPCSYAKAQRNSKEQSPHGSSFGSILPGLTDDVAMICLARVPRKHLPVMGAVCKRWRSFIQSKDFSFLRKETGMLEEWLYFLTPGVKKRRRILWQVMSSAQVKVWTIPPMPGPVTVGFCTAVLDGKLLIIGGYSKKIGLRSATADVHQYDARLNSWSMLAKMKNVRYDFTCSEVNGLIYAVGGCGSGEFEIMTAEVYDPDKNEWTLIEQLPSPRFSCFGFSFWGKLYVMGGFNTFNFINRCKGVDVYNPDSRSWCRLTCGLRKIFSAQVVLGKKLYCLHFGNLEIFDPADNSWSTVPLHYPKFLDAESQLGVLGGKLLFL